MPVTWEFRGRVLILSVSGIVANQEIDLAMGEALATAPYRSGIRLLWDARATETPVSADEVEWRIGLVSSLADRGFICRAALLGRSEQRASIPIWEAEGPKALRGLGFRLFTNESEALVWLEDMA